MTGTVGTTGAARGSAGRPARSWLRPRVVLRVACLLALAGVAALLVVRFAGLDDGTYLAIPVSGLPYVAAVSVVLLLVTLPLRSPALVLTALALVVVQLALLTPRFVADGTDIPPEAPTLRVATSNTLRGGADPHALVDLVREQRIDVLAVQEFTSHDAVRALDDAGMWELMPYRELHPEIDTSIYSRLPLRDAGLLDAPTTWPQTAATARVGGRDVRLVAVHLYYPYGDPGRWARDLAALRGAAGPDVVLLGDFNATLDHTPMRELLAGGLTDAHAELGHGWAPTWPARGTFPPLLQLDHVLYGSGLAAVSVSEHVVPGTDHHAVVAELAVLPRG